MSEPVGESVFQNESIPGNGNINDQNNICNNEGVGRPKRMVKPPAYLEDYVTCKAEILFYFNCIAYKYMLHVKLEFNFLLIGLLQI